MVQIRIVSDTGQALPERTVGEILVRSTTLFSGYLGQPELSAAALTDGWIRTGDLGYLSAGEVYLCGRKKDLIISHGRNLYPEDIEAVAESVAEVRKGRAVAFGVADERTGSERVVLVCELVRSGATAEPAAARSHAAPTARSFWPERV